MNDMEIFEDLKDLLVHDIDDVVKKGNIDPSDYEGLCKAVKIYKDLSTIEAMEEYGEDEEMYENPVSRSPRYNMRMSNNRGSSYRRGRGADGRYVSRDGHMNGDMETLNEMLSHAKNDAERQMIERMMQQM